MKRNALQTLLIVGAILVFGYLTQGCNTPDDGSDLESDSEVVAASISEQEEGEDSLISSINDEQKKDDELDRESSATLENSVTSAAYPVAGSIHLILELTEVSRATYIGEHGEEELLAHPVTAVATHIGRVKVNTAVLESGALKQGDQLIIQLFDGIEYTITIDDIKEGKPSAFSGSINNTEYGIFYGAVDAQTITATLEVPAKNSAYLLRYNAKIKDYYLYQATLQNPAILQDGVPLVPPPDEK